MKKRNGCLTVTGNLLQLLAGMAMGAFVLALFLYVDPSEAVTEESKNKEQQNESISAETPGDTSGAFDISVNTERNGYYYGLLEDEDQEVYQNILTGLLDLEAEIKTSEEDAEHVNEIYGLVLRDYPDIFWCDGGVSTTSYETRFIHEHYSVVKPEYNCTPEEKKEKERLIRESAAEILSEIDPEASDYEKVKYVYESIISMVDYEIDSEDSQNIASVFINKKSVCAGYAKAVQYLLEELGVPVIFVSGTAKGDSRHAWNIVKIDETYCQVDATWGDPVYSEDTASGEILEWETINYDYLCCSDEEINRTHASDTDYPLPACSSMEYNYYVLNGMYYEEYDETAIMDAFNKNIYAQENPTIFKFASESDYQTAKDQIVNVLAGRAAKTVSALYGKMQVRYYYSDQPEVYRITFFWDY